MPYVEKYRIFIKNISVFNHFALTKYDSIFIMRNFFRKSSQESESFRNFLGFFDV